MSHFHTKATQLEKKNESLSSKVVFLEHQRQRNEKEREKSKHGNHTNSNLYKEPIYTTSKRNEPQLNDSLNSSISSTAAFAQPHSSTPSSSNNGKRRSSKRNNQNSDPRFSKINGFQLPQHLRLEDPRLIEIPQVTIHPYHTREHYLPEFETTELLKRQASARRKKLDEIDKQKRSTWLDGSDHDEHTHQNKNEFLSKLDSAKDHKTGIYNDIDDRYDGFGSYGDKGNRSEDDEEDEYIYRERKQFSKSPSPIRNSHKKSQKENKKSPTKSSVVDPLVVPFPSANDAEPTLANRRNPTKSNPVVLLPKWKHEDNEITRYNYQTEKTRVGGGWLPQTIVTTENDQISLDGGLPLIDYHPGSDNTLLKSGFQQGSIQSIYMDMHRLLALVEYYEEALLMEQGFTIVPERQLKRYAHVVEDMRDWMKEMYSYQSRLTELVNKKSKLISESNRNHPQQDHQRRDPPPPPPNGTSSPHHHPNHDHEYMSHSNHKNDNNQLKAFFGEVGEVPSNEELYSWKNAFDHVYMILDENEERETKFLEAQRLIEAQNKELESLRSIVFKKRFNFGVQTDDETAYYEVIDSLVDEICAEIAEEPHHDDRGGSQGIPPLIRELLSEQYENATEGTTLLSLKVVYRYVNTIYADKIKANTADDESNNPRQAMPEFVYDHFLHKFGVRSIAEMHLVNFIFSLNHYEGENPDIETFNRFLDRHPSKLSDFYLSVMRFLKTSKHGVIVTDLEGHGLLVSLSRATFALKTVFDGFSRDGLKRLEQEVEEKAKMTSDALLKKHANLRKQKVIPMLMFLEIVLDCWYAEHNRARKRLAKMFDAFDTDRSGSLDLEEFRELMIELTEAKAAGANRVPLRRATQLFRDRARATGKNELSRTQFILFAPQIGLGFHFNALQK